MNSLLGENNFSNPALAKQPWAVKSPPLMIKQLMHCFPEWIPVSEMELTDKTELKDFLVYRKNKTICVAYWAHCCQFRNPGDIEWKMMMEEVFDDYGEPEKYEVTLTLKDVLFFMALPQLPEEKE
jgi:hypothetical protein|tara:strand:- start:794 stop:1168 length:375 start_codon:yes stop_codon:yes gene_type:complete